jgi:hypothetical protein
MLQLHSSFADGPLHEFFPAGETRAKGCESTPRRDGSLLQVNSMDYIV